MLLDPEVLGDELADLVLEQVAKATAPLREQIRELTAKLDGFRQARDGNDADPEMIRREVALAVAEIPRPKDGDSVDMGHLSEQIIAAAVKAVEALPRPKDGQDYDPAALDAAVERAVAALPRPKDGADADAKAIAADVLAQVQEALDAIPVPTNGKDADIEVMRSVVRDEVRLAIADLPKPADGKSIDPVELSGQIMEAAAKAVAAIPPPKNGRDFDPDVIKVEVERAVAALPKAKDGHTPSPAELEPLVAGAVERAVKALPPPKPGDPGKSVTLDDVAPLVARAIEALPKPKDGVSPDPKAIVAEVLETVTRGLKVPEDGKSVTLDDVRPLMDSAISRQALEFERRADDVMHAAIERAMADLPTPKAGVDGFTVDDFEAELKDERTIVLRLCAGERVVEKELKLAGMPVDRGSYSAGKAYQKGDVVTYGGGMWLAQQDTDVSPGDSKGEWRLAVKRGRDAPSRGFGSDQK